MIPMNNRTLPHWDLTPVYKGVDTPDFTGDLEKVSLLCTRVCDDIRAHKPLYDIIMGINEVMGIYWTLSAYSNAVLSTDTSNGAYIKAVGQVEDAGLKFIGMENLFTVSIASFRDEFSDPRLKDYSYILDRYLTDSTHMMSLAEEALASDLARSGVGAFERLYDAVSSTIGTDGKTVIQLRNDATNPDREVRKADRKSVV